MFRGLQRGEQTEQNTCRERESQREDQYGSVQPNLLASRNPDLEIVAAGLDKCSQRIHSPEGKYQPQQPAHDREHHAFT